MDITVANWQIWTGNLIYDTAQTPFEARNQDTKKSKKNFDINLDCS